MTDDTIPREEHEAMARLMSGGLDKVRALYEEVVAARDAEIDRLVALLEGREARLAMIGEAIRHPSPNMLARVAALVGGKDA